MLEESCLRSHEIIEDVLESSLVEEESGEIEKEYCYIPKLIEKAVNTHYCTAEKKSIKVVTKLQPDIFAFVYPKKLQRAIENLLSNAVKFSYRNGQVQVSLSGKEDSFVIKVKDFGLGMNEFQKASLFKDKPARKRGANGEESFGKGLKIVKKITNQHRGNVKVESQESAGTAFYLELPVDATI